MRWRDFLLVMTVAATAATPALAQEGARSSSSQGVPHLSGIWVVPYFGVDAPLSGPGPVVSRPGIVGRIVGDYTNPILKPHAAAAVKKLAEMELGGVAPSNPRNQCWPEGLPFILVNPAILMIQQPTKVLFFYEHDHQVRHVYLNQPHPAQVVPSWYGDSVGHYDGDTLVIDTVGFKMGPFSMGDFFGTPFTRALHVVERYRPIDNEAAIEAQERGRKTHAFVVRGAGTQGGLAIDPSYKGKGLQLELTVEDEGVFTMPYSATVTYLRGSDRRGSQEWPELVCAENPYEYSGKDSGVPHSDRPDF
jgi:hypothetical protein